MNMLRFLLVLLALTSARAAIVPEEVFFVSGNYTLRGYLYRPSGEGRFPVMIWNHGHAGHLAPMPAGEYSALAKFFLNNGYVFFMPDRHVDITSKDYSEELQKLISQPPSAEIEARKFHEKLDLNNRDIIAALDWIKTQPYADPNRIVMSGWSSGGMQALSLADQNLGVRACVVFSPGVLSWYRTPPHCGQPCYRRRGTPKRRSSLSRQRTIPRWLWAKSSVVNSGPTGRITR